MALAGAIIPLLQRRWGWLGFGLASAVLVGAALAIGHYAAQSGPPITTPPRLNWLCIATPIPITVAAALVVLALTTAQLKLPTAPLQQHIAVSVAVSAIAFVVLLFTTGLVYLIGYLGCDTL